MNLIKQFRLIVILAASLTTTACVSTQTVSTKQVNDATLSCSSIATRLGEVRSGKRYAKANQGLSGSNLAAALLFWPALLVNTQNTNNMIKSMDEREAVLVGYYNNKNCTDPIPSYSNKQIKQKIKSGDTEESFT